MPQPNAHIYRVIHRSRHLIGGLALVLGLVLAPGVAHATMGSDLTPTSGTNGQFTFDWNGNGYNLFAPGTSSGDLSPTYCDTAHPMHCDVSASGLYGNWTVQVFPSGSPVNQIYVYSSGGGGGGGGSSTTTVPSNSVIKVALDGTISGLTQFWSSSTGTSEEALVKGAYPAVSGSATFVSLGSCTGGSCVKADISTTVKSYTSAPATTGYYHVVYWDGTSNGGTNNGVYAAYDNATFGLRLDLYFDGTYWYLRGVNGSLVGNVTTRFTATVPTDSQVVGTTTMVGASWYISSADFVSGMHVRLDAESNGCLYAGVSVYTTVNSPCASFDRIYVATTSGQSGVATTTYMATLGGYSLSSTISKPGFSLFGISFGDDVVTATTTRFTISTSTVLDVLRNQAESDMEQLASTTAQIVNCTTSFNLGQCLTLTLVPSALQWKVIFDNIQGGIFGQGPWGFLGTTLSVVQGNYYVAGQTTLPTLTVDLKDTHLPGVQGATAIVINPWDKLIGTNSLLGQATSTKDGATLRTIVEPGWNTFVLLSFALAMFFEIISFGGKAATMASNENARASRRSL